MNSSNEKLGFRSTRPSISNLQVARSISGAPCASSTGHFFVRDCPGGIRCSRRVSGLIMISGSGTSSGGRGSLCWYFGSLIRPFRKLITLVPGTAGRLLLDQRFNQRLLFLDQGAQSLTKDSL